MNQPQLVVQTAYPGDLLLCIPLLRQIRKFYPQDKIVLLCRQDLGDLFLQRKLVDEVIAVNKKDGASFRQALAKVRSREWSRVFCPHESYRSAFWVRSLKVREFSVGFRKGWNFWAFTHRVDKPKDLPDALRQLSLLREMNPEFAKVWKRDLNEGAFRNRKNRSDVSFSNDPAIPDWASMQLAAKPAAGSTIFIAPGSVWPTKTWTPTGFLELAKRLRGEGREVVFVGSKGEQELCETLAREAGATSRAGKTSIPQLIDLFQTGGALVSNDSGAMHAAAVAGLPTVAVFGPTVLEFGFRPWQNRASVVQLDLQCRPCASHGGKRCPIKTHACMRDLPASQVGAALAKLLAERRA